jgi:hypothetical protein
MNDDALPRHFKGKRPGFFDDPAIDALLKIVVELMQEHWATRERLLTLEVYLAAHGAIDGNALAAFTPPADLDAERDDYIRRILAILDRAGT